MVCEVRYDDGQLYLDHCGRLLKKLLKDAPEWIVCPNPTPQGTSLFDIVAATQLGFSMASASLALDKSLGDEVISEEEAGDFIKQVGAVLTLVLDELEVSRFTRLGYREQYFFPFESKEESENWIRGLGLFTVAPTFLEGFHASQEEMGVVVVIEGEDCRYRVGLNGVERSAQVPVGEASVNIRSSLASKEQKQALLQAMKKKRQRQIDSAFAVVLDIDAYQQEPVEPDIAGFVKERNSSNLQMFRDALPKDTSKRK
jgi:hypothetical protein